MSHLDVEHGIADHHRVARLDPAFGHRLKDHAWMRFRGRVVRGLDRREDPFEPKPLDEVAHSALRLAGGDSDKDVIASTEPAQQVDCSVKGSLWISVAGPIRPEG